MKAESYVFTYVQHPFSYFGLPPVLAVFSLIAGVIAWVLLTAFGAKDYAMVGLLLTVGVCGGVSFRLAYKDPHIVPVTIEGTRFWRGNTRRVLLAGIPEGRSQESR